MARTRGPGLSSAGNRGALAFLVAVLTFIAFHRTAVSLLVGVVFYFVLTAIISRRDSGES